MSDPYAPDPYDITGRERARLEREHAAEIAEWRGTGRALRQDQLDDPETTDYLYDPKTGQRVAEFDPDTGKRIS
jgi:hypothetical protein